MQANWRNNNGETILQACLADLEIDHLAKDLTQPFVDKKEFVYLLEPYQVNDNATWLIYPRKNLIPYRVRLLIDFLL